MAKGTVSLPHAVFAEVPKQLNMDLHKTNENHFEVPKYYPEE